MKRRDRQSTYHAADGLGQNVELGNRRCIRCVSLHHRREKTHINSINCPFNHFPVQLSEFRQQNTIVKSNVTSIQTTID